MTPAARERTQVRVPLLAISAAAWLTLVATPAGEAHGRHASMPLSSLAIDSFLMLAAMMAPLLAEPVRYIRDRSLARQRARSIAAFVAGYATVWMAAGALLQAIALRARLVESPLLTIGIACAAAVWQCSPLKQRGLNRGHLHPELAAGGRPADVAAMRFGVTHGVWCVGSCWTLMLLPLLVSRGQVIAMMAVSLWLAAERFERPAPPSWRLRGPSKAMRTAWARLVAIAGPLSASPARDRRPSRRGTALPRTATSR